MWQFFLFLLSFVYVTSAKGSIDRDLQDEKLLTFQVSLPHGVAEITQTELSRHTDRYKKWAMAQAAQALAQPDSLLEILPREILQIITEQSLLVPAILSTTCRQYCALFASYLCKQRLLLEKGYITRRLEAHKGEPLYCWAQEYIRTFLYSQREQAFLYQHFASLREMERYPVLCRKSDHRARRDVAQRVSLFHAPNHTPALPLTAVPTHRLSYTQRNLTVIPYNIDRLNFLCKTSDHTLHLDFANNQIFMLTLPIFALENLVHLDLQNNQLFYIPKEIMRLSKMKSLNLSNNHIKKLPNQFFCLKQLRDLNLASNELQKVSTLFADLKALTRLDLSGNSLAQLPLQFFQLKQLEYLVMHDTSLKKLPNEIGQLKALSLLNVSNNQLKTLPSSLFRIEALRILYVENNLLEALPRAEIEAHGHRVQKVSQQYQAPALFSFFCAGNPKLDPDTIPQFPILHFNMHAVAHKKSSPSCCLM